MRTKLLRFRKAFSHYVVVDIAERRNFDVRQRAISSNMLLATASQPDDCNAYSVIRTHDVRLWLDRQLRDLDALHGAR